MFVFVQCTSQSIIIQSDSKNVLLLNCNAMNNQIQDS